MPSSEVAITNLLFRYAEYIDSGDFDGAASLFEHAQVKLGDSVVGSSDLAKLWKDHVIIYEDGTPRTKHVFTNPIVEVDDEVGQATCRSYYTVTQQAPGYALDVVICGRYRDEFERVDGTWRFKFRDYALHDLPGNMSRHAK